MDIFASIAFMSEILKKNVIGYRKSLWLIFDMGEEFGRRMEEDRNGPVVFFSPGLPFRCFSPDGK